jgi:hypothetical protein
MIDLLEEPKFYDKYGQEISRREWARLHENEDYCRIGYTEIGSVYVSTVWLGEDHGRMFETMVFWISTGLNGDLPSTRRPWSPRSWPNRGDERGEGHRPLSCLRGADP